MMPISSADSTFLLLCSDIGKAIRRSRRRRGLTQAALAAECRIHVSHLSKIERGLANATLASLFAITVSLGTTLAELFNETRQPGT